MSIVNSIATHKMMFVTGTVTISLGSLLVGHLSSVKVHLLHLDLAEEYLCSARFSPAGRKGEPP